MFKLYQIIQKLIQNYSVVSLGAAVFAGLLRRPRPRLAAAASGLRPAREVPHHGGAPQRQGRAPRGAERRQLRA